MKIKIHRGLEQIGGCITEISTETSRVFIDMGQNLPGNGKKTTPEQDKKMVENLFINHPKKYQAVVYTHAHEDHVGLFGYVPDNVPQYIGEGSKEILMAKYELIMEGHKLNLESALTSSVTNPNNCKQEMCEELQQTIEEDKKKIEKLNAFHTWPRPKPHTRPSSFSIGDINITPFFNCHSIYDSYMLLIDDGKERIWHTGDYREHGYMGKGLIPTLKRYARNIDVLITEGTMLGRNDECIHESEVSRKMACVMDAFKYVVVLASATDIERLASIKEAAQKAQKQWYICSGYMNRTMHIFTRREAKYSKGLFEFHPKYVSQDDPKIMTMKKKGFILIAGVNQLETVENICSYIDNSQVVFIYSTWDGYYKDPAQISANPKYEEFRKAFSNIVDIHTSGHADKATIHKIIKVITPKKVICIHKEAGTSL